MSDLQPFLLTRKRPMKLNTLVTLMVCAIIASVLLLVFALYSVQITRATRDDVKDTALGIARTLADSPEIQRGLMQSPQADIIQPIAKAVTQRNDLLLTVVTDMRGIRYSHPNEALIGLHFIGNDLEPAPKVKRMSRLTGAPSPKRFASLPRFMTASTIRSGWWWSVSLSKRWKTRLPAGG